MQTKTWYTSKLFWVGVLITLQGIIPLVQDMLNKGPITADSVLVLLSGLTVVVLRVWFTDTPIQRA